MGELLAGIVIVIVIVIAPIYLKIYFKTFHFEITEHQFSYSAFSKIKTMSTENHRWLSILIVKNSRFMFIPLISRLWFVLTLTRHATNSFGDIVSPCLPSFSMFILSVSM